MIFMILLGVSIGQDLSSSATAMLSKSPTAMLRSKSPTAMFRSKSPTAMFRSKSPTAMSRSKPSSVRRSKSPTRKFTLPPTPMRTNTFADCWNPEALSRCAMKMVNQRPKLCARNVTRPTCMNKDITKELTVDGMTKNVSLSVSCPSCIPESAIRSFCKMKVTNICPTGRKPKPDFKEIPLTIASKSAGTKFSLCPDCLPKFVPSTCTKTDIKACSVKLAAGSGRPRDCGVGERPIKEGCCFSCTPLSVTCTKITCPQMRACNMKNNTAGRLSNEASVLKSNCCRSCIPDGIKKKVGEKCTRAQFTEYMSTLPVCEYKEKAVVDTRVSHVCGPSCKRPESSRNISDVMQCLRTRSKCDAVTPTGETELVLPGDACASCIRKRPTCTCSGLLKENGVCVRKNGKSVCVKKIKLGLKLKLKSVKQEIKRLNTDETVELIREFISRFCERASSTDRCASLKDRVLDSLKCTKKKNSTRDSSTIDIELEMAESPVATKAMAQGRRLLGSTSHDTANLVEDAIADDEDYVDSIQTTSTPASGSKSIVSGFIILMSLISHLLTVI